MIALRKMRQRSESYFPPPGQYPAKKGKAFGTRPSPWLYGSRIIGFYNKVHLYRIEFSLLYINFFHLSREKRR